MAQLLPAEDDSGASPDGDMPSTIPAELAGTAWTWTTSAGAQRLGFGVANGYTNDVFLDAHPGDSCGRSTSRAVRAPRRSRARR